MKSPELIGNWFLIEAQCHCAFDDTIDLQDFKLRFDNSENLIQLNNPTESYFYIAESGRYKYHLEGNIIKIEGVEDSYKYEVKGTTLILTRIDNPLIADDELVLTYKKI